MFATCESRCPKKGSKDVLLGGASMTLARKFERLIFRRETNLQDPLSCLRDLASNFSERNCRDNIIQ